MKTPKSPGPAKKAIPLPALKNVVALVLVAALLGSALLGVL